MCVGFRASTFNIMSERVSKNIRTDYYTSVINQDVAFFDDRRTGDLRKYQFNLFVVSRLNSDIQIIQDGLSTNVSIFVRCFVFCVTVIVIMVLISPVLAGITLASIVPIMIFASIFGSKMRKLTKQQQEERAKMTTVAEESFSNVRTVKAFSNEDYELS